MSTVTCWWSLVTSYPVTPRSRCQRSFAQGLERGGIPARKIEVSQEFVTGNVISLLTNLDKLVRGEQNKVTLAFVNMVIGLVARSVGTVV